VRDLDSHKRRGLRFRSRSRLLKGTCVATGFADHTSESVCRKHVTSLLMRNRGVEQYLSYNIVSKD